MLDVIIIGAGIVGTATAYNLSKYNLDVAVLEKENDVATGTTKANSAIIHAGYDPKPDTLMAKLNVKGSKITKEICEKLDVKYNQIGSMVLAFTKEEQGQLQILYQQGVQSGVQDLQILTSEQLQKEEPNVSKKAMSALYAPTAAIIDPWEFCLALLQTAVKNNLQLYLENEVIDIKKIDGGFIVITDKGEYKTKNIFNAAGVYADKIHNMVAAPSFKIYPHKGEYFLLDKCECKKANHILFQAPKKDSKGVLVLPTVHGNLLVGPNSLSDDALDTSTTLAGLEYVKQKAKETIPKIDYRQNIRNFAGLRATTDREDFIIEKAKDIDGFFDLAGIKSPGLSAAAAIGEMALEMLKDSGVELQKKEKFVDTRKAVRFKELDIEQKQELIKQDPSYARVVCRCETVTEGEIVACLKSEIPPVSVDGVKRRVGAGMGRCQGGFCSPKVMQILAQHQNVDINQILQDTKDTVILMEKPKRRQTMIYDVIVVGGGPAGLSAALAAYNSGAKNVIVLERDTCLGGILNQCIHNGFGLHYFKEELTGPEYAQRFVDKLSITNIEISYDTMVLKISKDKTVHIINKQNGYQILKSKAIVLAMGCRERTRGAIATPGTRPAGIFTAGTAQRFVNIEGYMVGKKVVILGSGDIGLIMARRMTLEGAKVLACVEIMPYSGGLNRNIVQCLEDYDIPLFLSHTITQIKGDKRLTGLVVAKVDENRMPIKGSEINFDCDTLLLSVGLIPENELTTDAQIPIDTRTNGAIVYENMQTKADGIFACGNAVHVHDLVDFVTIEGEKAGKGAAEYAENIENKINYNDISIQNAQNVSYTVPQIIRCEKIDKRCDVFFRVTKVMRNSKISITDGEKEILHLTKEHLAPGEMEKISIPKVMLEKINTNCITISAQEVE